MSEEKTDEKVAVNENSAAKIEGENVASRENNTGEENSAEDAGAIAQQTRFGESAAKKITDETENLGDPQAAQSEQDDTTSDDDSDDQDGVQVVVLDAEPDSSIVVIDSVTASSPVVDDSQTGGVASDGWIIGEDGVPRPGGTLTGLFGHDEVVISRQTKKTSAKGGKLK